MRRFLEWKARMTGCLDRTICFKGSAPHYDVPQFYAQADASLMTMAPFELLYRHSVQNKFFDSLAAGKPVFANYAGWASDVAEQEGAGLILPRDDIASAARILAEHLESESWLARAGKAARRLAEECFSRDRLAEQLEEVLLSATRK
jgi:glycosyltransferase involved in cell wall biosynthesis